jgi:hypothetical protein
VRLLLEEDADLAEIREVFLDEQNDVKWRSGDAIAVMGDVDDGESHKRNPFGLG